MGAPGAPGSVAFETTVQDALGAALGPLVDYHSEYIDLGRFGDSNYTTALGEFLRFKYRLLPPDVVISTTEPVRQFAKELRANIFPQAPIIFIGRDSSPAREPNSTGLIAPVDMAATVDLLLALQPDTRHLFVVSSVSAFDRGYEALARAQLVRFESRVAAAPFGDFLSHVHRSTAGTS